MTMPTTPKQDTKRVRKSPAEKAQHALDVEQRRYDALNTKRTALRKEADALDAPLAQSAKRLDYLKASPDLPQPTLTGEDAPEPKVDKGA